MAHPIFLQISRNADLPKIGVISKLTKAILAGNPWTLEVCITIDSTLNHRPGTITIKLAENIDWLWSSGPDRVGTTIVSTLIVDVTAIWKCNQQYILSSCPFWHSSVLRITIIADKSPSLWCLACNQHFLLWNHYSVFRLLAICARNAFFYVLVMIEHISATNRKCFNQIIQINIQAITLYPAVIIRWEYKGHLIHFLSTAGTLYLIKANRDQEDLFHERH